MKEKKAKFAFIIDAECEDAICNFTAIENCEAEELTIKIDGCNELSAAAIAELLHAVAYHFDAVAENGEEWAD